MRAAAREARARAQWQGLACGSKCPAGPALAAARSSALLCSALLHLSSWPRPRPHSSSLFLGPSTMDIWRPCICGACSMAASGPQSSRKRCGGAGRERCKGGWVAWAGWRVQLRCQGPCGRLQPVHPSERLQAGPSCRHSAASAGPASQPAQRRGLTPNISRPSCWNSISRPRNCRLSLMRCPFSRNFWAARTLTCTWAGRWQ